MASITKLRKKARSLGMKNVNSFKKHQLEQLLSQVPEGAGQKQAAGIAARQHKQQRKEEKAAAGQMQRQQEADARVAESAPPKAAGRRGQAQQNRSLTRVRQIQESLVRSRMGRILNDMEKNLRASPDLQKALDLTPEKVVVARQKLGVR